MVWALIDPSGLGDYFPSGEHLGWREALEAFFQEQMTDEDRERYSGRLTSYIYQVSRKFREDLGLLEPHEMPREFLAATPHKSLSSLIVTEGGLHAVDETLKDLIEGLEPGVHQFWPMRILMPGGKDYPTPYYGMVIRQFFDSFRPEQSVEGSWVGDPSYYMAFGATKAHMKGLAFDKGVFGSAHLWRETRMRQPQVLMSDALQGAIEQAGLRIWRHFKAKEV